MAISSFTTHLPELQVGSRVEVRALQGMPVLNGRQGTVWRAIIQDYEGVMRWPVKLDATRAAAAGSVACRAVHLRVLEGPLSTDLAQPAGFPEGVD